MSLQEYETQLAEIEQMLASSPDDPSLLSLKSDLLELIAATLGTTATTEDAAAAADDDDDDADPAPVEEATAVSQQEPAALEWNTVNDDKNSTTQSSDNPLAQTTTTTAATSITNDTTTTTTNPPKKKKSANGVFTIPADLEIQPNDSKFQVNRKKRAQAALRKQHQAQQDSQQATKKQQSWQAFAQHRKKGRAGSSMFQTDASAKVGVVGQRRLTKFEGPKKHK